VREADVQRAVMQLLTLRGFRVFRRNVMGNLVLQGKHGSRVVKVGVKGQSDLYGWHRRTGRHFEIEVKAPGNKPTPDQAAWLASADADGALAFWTDSVSCTDQTLTHLGY